jgi:hypothetical protein
VKLAAPSAAAGTKRVWNAVCVTGVDPVGGVAGKASGCTRVRSDASVRGRRLAVKSAPLHTAGGGGCYRCGTAATLCCIWLKPGGA